MALLSERYMTMFTLSEATGIGMWIIKWSYLTYFLLQCSCTISLSGSTSLGVPSASPKFLIHSCSSFHLVVFRCTPRAFISLVHKPTLSSVFHFASPAKVRFIMSLCHSSNFRSTLDYVIPSFHWFSLSIFSFYLIFIKIFFLLLFCCFMFCNFNVQVGRPVKLCPWSTSK